MKKNIVDQRKHHYRSNKVDTARTRIYFNENQITGTDRRAEMTLEKAEGKENKAH